MSKTAEEILDDHMGDNLNLVGMTSGAVTAVISAMEEYAQQVIAKKDELINQGRDGTKELLRQIKELESELNKAKDEIERLKERIDDLSETEDNHR